MRRVFLCVLLILACLAATAEQSAAQNLTAHDRLLESLRRDLTDRLQASGKFSSIAAAGKSSLKAKLLDGSDLVVELAEVAAAVAQTPAARAEIVGRFAAATVASLERPKQAGSREDFIASLRLMVRPKAYVATLPTAANGRGQAPAPPLSRALAGDVVIVVALVEGERIAFATAGAGQAFGLKDDDLYEHGRQHLLKLVADLETEDAGGVRAFLLPDEIYTPSLLALDEPWAKVEADLGTGFVVAIPDRNTLLAAPAKNIAQLRAAVDLIARSRKSAPMIGEVLQRSGGGWRSLGSR